MSATARRRAHYLKRPVNQGLGFGLTPHTRRVASPPPLRRLMRPGLDLSRLPFSCGSRTFSSFARGFGIKKRNVVRRLQLCRTVISDALPEGAELPFV